MQLRLKKLSDVRVFSLSIIVIAVISCVVLLHLFLPQEAVDLVLVEGIMITVIISAPITYFVGQKLLEISKLSAELEYAVNHDALTGAVTRSRFRQIVETRPDNEAVLVVADIDHFKKVNDVYGHIVGDVALRRFAQILVKNSRPQDVVARFGGEEFVVLLDGISTDDGVATVERLREKVRQTRIDVDDNELSMTASFGVVDLNPDDMIDMAFERADLAVYRAKRDGRDRVCVFDPEIDHPTSRASAAA